MLLAIKGKNHDLPAFRSGEIDRRGAAAHTRYLPLGILITARKAPSWTKERRHARFRLQKKKKREGRAPSGKDHDALEK